MTLLEISGLHLAIGDTPILKGVDLSLEWCKLLVVSG